MPPSSRGGASAGGLLHSIMGPKSAASFRPKEKYLIFLVLATFCFVCFGAIFFLPTTDSRNGKRFLEVNFFFLTQFFSGTEVSSQNMNRVYQVYKGLQDAGRDILLPAPPLDRDNNADHPDPNQFPHGVIDKPDPHKVEDRVRLLAQIEMDAQLNELRQKQIEEQKQRVLAKPNFNHDPSEENNQVSKEVWKPAAKEPLISGGEDKDPVARQRRDTVKAMMQHAWNGYVKHAWGKNELRPVSLRGHTSSIFGSSSMGASIIDALDTLLIMGMKDEFEKGRDWVADNLDLNKMVCFILKK